MKKKALLFFLKLLISYAPANAQTADSLPQKLPLTITKNALNFMHIKITIN